MKLFLFVALLSSTALADYKTVLQDIALIKQNLVTVNNSLVACTPGPMGITDALNVQTVTNNLENVITQTINDVNASPPFGKMGSNKVGRRVISLSTATIALLSETVSKYSFFDSPLGLGPGVISLTNIVEQSLTTQKQQSDQLGAALVQKFDATLQGSAPFIQSQIDAAFATAIATYSS